ncbi:Mu transposase C-terminal domain-containing protein [uncultured Tateyamaria sp.]|uniref:Mu transposase C-terminal domain-containing protein n=1 Tax=uncultured Tateyamaria sp. TaxID=455651 RepID=UPI00260D1DD9|nr:Mu transposase C-terminal domain-containing protein [uncultured Tateyamaria sp.]
MLKPHFTTNDRALIGKPPHYRFLGQDATTTSWLREGENGQVEHFTYEQLTEFRKSSQWRYDRDYYDLTQTKLASSMPALTLDHLSESARKKTIWYFIICMAVKAMYDAGEISLTDASITMAKAALQEKMNEIEAQRHNIGVDIKGFTDMRVRKLPCSKTIRTKFATLRRFGYNLLSLSPGWFRATKIGSKFNEETEAAVMQLVRAIASREMDNKAEIARQVIDRLMELNEERALEGIGALGVPSQRTIERRIAAMNQAELYAIFHGADAARKEFALSAGGRPRQFAMDEIMFDECEVDLFTYFTNLGIYDHLPKLVRENLPRGRRWICAAIDTRTRVILGIRVAEKPSAEEAVKLLRMVVRDKTDIAKAMGAESLWSFHGGLGMVACDTGSAFASDEFISAVTALGGTIFFPPVKIPELRAEIERVFGTINSKLLTRLYGRAFHKPSARGDYDSEGRAVLDDDELARILTIFFVDFYHHNQHTGLNFKTPANCWAEVQEKYFINAPPDRHTVRSAVGVEMQRKLSKRGIDVFGNYYTCPELQAFWHASAKRQMRIKVDPHDIGAISILIGDTWVSADALDCDLDGVHMSSWVKEFREIKAHNKAESELSSDLRDRALKNIDAICQKAALRAGIGPHDLTKEQVLRLQKDPFHGTTFKPRPEIGSLDETPDMMGTRFDTGTALEPTEPPQRPSMETDADPTETPQPITKPTWKLEDK